MVALDVRERPLLQYLLGVLVHAQNGLGVDAQQPRHQLLLAFLFLLGLYKRIFNC